MGTYSTDSIFLALALRRSSGASPGISSRDSASKTAARPNLFWYLAWSLIPTEERELKVPEDNVLELYLTPREGTQDGSVGLAIVYGPESLGSIPNRGKRIISFSDRFWGLVSLPYDGPRGLACSAK